ncbi:hypothetical protein SAY87_014916 [Trapa incisa]|uniref:ACT domain-containing protein ACR n=1 Tax=Trapa incisa TaxID=236973 RepID=A0AAN7JLJ3_9MYRT|nr:hypothetical protein SAY87_014916 [Trapa incisa]
MKVSSPYFDPEFDSLTERIYGTKVSIDNDSGHDCTVIKIDGLNKQGLLLEVVQILTDLNLSMSKIYISADGKWFMDVFHVKDEKGNKLYDQAVIDYIQQAIGTASLDGLTLLDMGETRDRTSYKEPKPSCDHTTIELVGAERPGLLSEILAVLSDLHCRIVKAHTWTHNSRLACIAHVSDRLTDAQINDPGRLAAIEDRLASVISGTGSVVSRSRESPTGRVDCSVADLERRLHRLMLSARDFDESYELYGLSRSPSPSLSPAKQNPVVRAKHVSVEECEEKGYLIVSIRCKDRRRLMFDCVCTLTDMRYAVFHASGRLCDRYSFQEYFIRHMDGWTQNRDKEKEHIIKCMEAALARRISKGSAAR